MADQNLDRTDGRDQHSSPLSDDVPSDLSQPAPPAQLEQEAMPPSRRRFLGACARRLAYAAPVVLLFRPKQSLAASQGGSLITV